LAHYKVAGIITVPFHATLQALGIALLILQSIFRPGCGVFKLLNNPVVCKLGVLSYSIYIWHMIAWQTRAFQSFGNVWWRAFPGWIITGIGVAAISYYFLEKPLFQLRSKLTRQASAPRTIGSEKITAA
jgi:peptidoglycan/LPS O-acetylase OafA/YrhL